MLDDPDGVQLFAGDGVEGEGEGEQDGEQDGELNSFIMNEEESRHRFSGGGGEYSKRATRQSVTGTPLPKIYDDSLDDILGVSAASPPIHPTHRAQSPSMLAPSITRFGSPFPTATTTAAAAPASAAAASRTAPPSGTHYPIAIRVPLQANSTS